MVNSFPSTGLRPGAFALYLAGLDEASVRLCGAQVPLVVPPFTVIPAVADEGGTVVLAALVPPSLAGTALLLQVLDPVGCRLSPVRAFVSR